MNRIGRLYHGWYVLAAGYVCAGLMVGSTHYIFGLLIRPLTEEFDISRAQANNGLILFLLGTILTSPFVGYLLDRLPLKKVMISGAILFTASFLAISVAPSLWLIALLLIPAAAGVAAAGALAANKTITQWFHRRRGRAMGVLATATSAGGAVLVPLVAVLIENYGWRVAIAVLGVGAGSVAGILITALLGNRSGPLDAVERDSADGAAAQATEERSWSFRQLAITHNFWIIAVAVAIMMAIDLSLMATIVPYGMELGVSLTQASFILSVLTVSAIFGKMGVGLLAERFDKRLILAAVAGAHIFLLGALLLRPSYPVLLAVAGVSGLATGGTLPVLNMLVAFYFGGTSFGSVIGAMNVIALPLSMIAARFVGEVFDRTGSYDFAFWTFFGASFLSMVVIAFMRPPREL